MFKQNSIYYIKSFLLISLKLIKISNYIFLYNQILYSFSFFLQNFSLFDHGIHIVLYLKKKEYIYKLTKTLADKNRILYFSLIFADL